MYVDIQTDLGYDIWLKIILDADLCNILLLACAGTLRRVDHGLGHRHFFWYHVKPDDTASTTSV